MKHLTERLKKKQYREIWEEYCGFLDLNMKDYMMIQNRLMMEQINQYAKSSLGKIIMKGRIPSSIEEFRSIVPLTTYDDYADILLLKQGDMLPEEPIIWIQTTWEGGRHPVKLAPYSRSMLDTFRNNVVTCMLLSTSRRKGEFKTQNMDKILYGLAPLPYVTGLFPVALEEAVDVRFLPPVKEAVDMTFSQRNKEGFKQALKYGMDYFFGLGSVAYAVSLSLGSMSGGGGISSLLKCRPDMALRMIRAKIRCHNEKRSLRPGDLFRLKGFMVAGTDNCCYKDDLEKLWGVRPMELFAGTEPSLIGTETWSRNGMYFFPDTCFYEFITEKNMIRNMEDPTFQPPTCLMDEVVPGEKYELVISVLKGGAFVRYRVGDVYRCAGLENKEDDTHIPRFEYVDRIPSIIDIGGFTRISENSIEHVIALSGLKIRNWIAVKEYTPQKRPYMHLYAEILPGALASGAVTKEILKEQLSTYFRYVDQDYRDLKKILGVDPLVVTILTCGTFERYQRAGNPPLRHMNPDSHELKNFLKCQFTASGRSVR
ncbi:MAG: GH3 auxin-responsive promoter family protein [Lachnospiraceae bacterium]|nr:GH3 auxin-responsive promoter family protein [Lachnospiraceae bacterium]